MTWRAFSDYMTFRYRPDGTLDPVMLHEKDDISRDEYLGVLSVKQIEELYSLPHDPDNPATMDVTMPDGRMYRVVRFDRVRCRTRDTGRVYRSGKKRNGYRYYEDVDRGYVYAYPWSGPFPKNQNGPCPVPVPQPVTYSGNGQFIALTFFEFPDTQADANGIRDYCHTLAKNNFGLKGYCWSGCFGDLSDQWLAAHKGTAAPAPPADHKAYHSTQS